jgi:hypothetical protein
LRLLDHAAMLLRMKPWFIASIVVVAAVASILVLGVFTGGKSWYVADSDVDQSVQGEKCHAAWSPDSDHVAICPSGCFIEGPAFGGGKEWFRPDETRLKKSNELCSGARKVLKDSGYL